MEPSKHQEPPSPASSSDASVPDSFKYRSDATEENLEQPTAGNALTASPQTRSGVHVNINRTSDGNFLEWSAIRDWVRSNAPHPGRSCIRCKRGISDDDVHYHCALCKTGDFELCQSCFENHLGCLDESHLLTKRTVRLGKILYPEDDQSNKRLQQGTTFPSCTPPEHPHDSEESLGRVVDEYLKKQAYERNHEALQESRTMDRMFADLDQAHPGPPICSSFLRNWTQVNHLLRQNNIVPSFKDALSRTQMASLRILHEWWLAMIQDHQKVAKTISVLLSGCWVRDPAELKLHERAGLFGQLGEDQYHRALWNLFWAEMFTLHRLHAGQKIPQSLVSVRLAASQAAASQRIGYVLRHETLTPLWLKDKPRGSEADIHAAFRIVSGIIASYVTPIITEYAVHASWSEAARITFSRQFASLSGIVLGQPFLLYLADLASTERILGHRNLSATLEPCPWVPSEQHHLGLPFYLWDVRRAMTVKTSDLNFRPTYTAISHTWGRWTIDDKGASVSGVPWLIPRNTRFAVENLADILKKVPGGCSYIWFDLVCIPQIYEEEDLAEIGNTEIARQAIIFGNAKHAMAWFSDMADFGFLNETVYWLASNLVENPLSSLPGQHMHKTPRHTADFLHSDHSYPLTRSKFSVADFAHGEWQDCIHPWFTSL
jgi:Heterokaryon incompatibility protein (HET)